MAQPAKAQAGWTVADAQADMRHAYLGGAAGVFASALAWLAAGLVALDGAPSRAVLTLLVGGMMIHPVSMLLAKAMGRPGVHARGNPLGTLALEGTVWMVLGIALAYGISLWRSELFFPAMLLVIGGRYLTFASVYGMRVYWLCGATLAGAGLLLGANLASMAAGAFAGSAIETAFAVAFYLMQRRA
ncbi:hypothetical protein HGB41_01480 [Massilia sp. ML15P13]|uniref:Uncharacterized protein n=2 Tax=Telluria aromaticivorans TaxID=2725995 RepID=A0A7Y2JWG3_9BURK|nr:hypothetical protein [Telluria aromaticivorans]